MRGWRNKASFSRIVTKTARLSEATTVCITPPGYNRGHALRWEPSKRGRNRVCITNPRLKPGAYVEPSAMNKDVTVSVSRPPAEAGGQR
jgi:hypothetical protein